MDLKNNLYKIFVGAVILYQSTFYFLPIVINYFVFDERVKLDDSFFYPLSYILIVFSIGLIIKKIKIKPIIIKEPRYNYANFLFFVWVVASIILILTDNISTAFNSGSQIPFLSQLKFFNSLGIIFTCYYCMRFINNKISKFKLILYYVIIFYFTFLTLSKLLIFSNILVLFLILYNRIRFKLIILTLTFIFFIPIYNYLLDYRSSISNQLNLDIIQDQRALVIVENPFAEFIIDRLNYYKILKSSIETDYYFEKNPYSSNIYGLIPRFIYPTKPNIGVDTNKLGRDIMILSDQDFNTSLGIGVISESYVYLRYFGLITILFFALIFYLFRVIDNIPFKIMSIFIFTILDSFSVFLPTLIMILIFTIIFRTLQFE